MKLTNTACLVALLLACPLAATAVHGADYDVHYKSDADALDGKVASSGYKETPTGTWDNVYIGHFSVVTYSPSVHTVESSNNEGSLGEGLVVEGRNVYGGYARVSANQTNVQANSNILSLRKGVSFTNESKNVYGGFVEGHLSREAKGTASASNNTVTIQEGFEESIFNLYVGSIKDSNIEAQTSASSSYNKLYINNYTSKLRIHNIWIGSSSTQGIGDAYANNNYGNIEVNEDVDLEEFITIGNGASSWKGNAYACENELHVKGLKRGKDSSNRLIGGSVSNWYYGQDATVKANDNIMELTDVVLNTKWAMGGDAENEASGACTAEANGNTVILNGGTYTNLVGVADAELKRADSGTAEASNNRLELRNGSSGAPDLTNATILVADARVNNNENCTVKSTGNSINFYDVKGMTAKGISGFQILNYEYSEMHADDVILTVSDNSTSIAGADVNVSVGNLYGKNGGEFLLNDKVVLLKDDKGIDAGEEGFKKKTTITATTGISLSYEVDLQLNEEGTELILTRTGTKPDDTDDDSGKDDDSGNTDDDSGKDDDSGNTDDDSGKDDDSGNTDDDSGKDDDSGNTDDDSGKDDDSGNTDDDSGKDDDSGNTDDDNKTDGNSSSGTTVLPGTKAIAEAAASGLALVNESSNAAIEFLREFSLTARSITPFVHVQASSMRHQTGSSINLSSVSLLAGLGTGIETGAGNLSLGAFFEYGKGSYTTHNSFDSRSDVDGDGNAWYMGGGILAKMDFVPTGPGHFYLEGSAHMGTLHNEYDSNDLRDANGNVAKFDMDSPYYSLHGGLGYVWNMAEGHDLDVYGKYIWTRVQGTDDTLTTKDKFEYDDMDSNRIRFGVRYTYNGSERFKPYVGATYEHEFSGSCDSRVFGHSVAAPSFEGSSGMGELGLMMKPTEDLPLSIKLGVQGYVGQKQGISGNCNIMYEF